MANLTQVVSAVTPLDGALREPARRRRAPAKAAPKPTVGTTFVCHCGERFEDMREAWIHVRTEYGELRQILNEMRHPDTGKRLVAVCGTREGAARHRRRDEKPCDACLKAQAAEARERRIRLLNTDPTYRVRERERKAAYDRDPAHRERRRERDQARRGERRERDRARYATDPEYRERRREQRAAWERERRADPAYRERQNARNREARARKKAESSR